MDWFTISYRSVALLVVLVVAGATIGYLSWVRFGPRQQAEMALDRAVIQLDEASTYGGDPRLDELLASAGAALGEGQRAFGEREFSEARISAVRSQSLSRRVIDIASGNEERPSDVTFYSVEGDVRVKRRGSFAWESADKSMVLSIGDQIKTSSSASAQILYFDGTLTTIRPGSLLEIKELYENPVTKVRKVEQRLNWGEVTASTPDGNVAGSYHQVSTDKVTARSENRGEFRVAFDRQRGTAAFDVFTGRVRVDGGGESQLVTAGERLRADAEGALQSKQQLPGIPSLIAPSDEMVLVYEDAGKAKTRLVWEEVPGAVKYRLMISDQELFTSPRYDAYRADTEVEIDKIAAGPYFWRVAAISSAGVEGPFSETRLFRVTTERIRDNDDKVPPALAIDDFIQTGAMVIVNGHTEPGAAVWVGAEKIDVSDDGSFSTVVRLRREGMNELRFMAQDAAGNEQVEKKGRLRRELLKSVFCGFHGQSGCKNESRSLRFAFRII